MPSFEVRKQELRDLLTSGKDRDEVAKSATLSAGVDLLSALFSDDTPLDLPPLGTLQEQTVRAAALEVYVRRVYRAHRILGINVVNDNGRLTCTWTFQFADTPEEVSPVRVGQMSVVKDIAGLKSSMDEIIGSLSKAVSETGASTDAFTNVLHVAAMESSSKDDDVNAAAFGEVVSAQKAKLESLKVRTVNVLIPAVPRIPEYFSYTNCLGYTEDVLRRNMRPTFHHLLELGRLTSNHKLTRMESVGSNAQVYLGEEVRTRSSEPSALNEFGSCRPRPLFSVLSSCCPPHPPPRTPPPPLLLPGHGEAATRWPATGGVRSRAVPLPRRGHRRRRAPGAAAGPGRARARPGGRQGFGHGELPHLPALAP